MIFRGTDGFTGEMTFFSDCILSSLARILSKVKHAILENSSSMLKLSAARLSVFSKTFVEILVCGIRMEIKRATSILVTDVGDGLCWWQLCDVGDRFKMF